MHLQKTVGFLSVRNTTKKPKSCRKRSKSGVFGRRKLSQGKEIPDKLYVCRVSVIANFRWVPNFSAKINNYSFRTIGN